MCENTINKEMYIVSVLYINACYYTEIGYFAKEEDARKLKEKVDTEYSYAKSNGFFRRITDELGYTFNAPITNYAAVAQINVVKLQ